MIFIVSEMKMKVNYDFFYFNFMLFDYMENILGNVFYILVLWFVGINIELWW